MVIIIITTTSIIISSLSQIGFLWFWRKKGKRQERYWCKGKKEHRGFYEEFLLLKRVADLQKNFTIYFRELGVECWNFFCALPDLWVTFQA